MKVFGIGLSRTGTSSLTRAFRILGWPSIHYPKSLEEIEEYEGATDISVAYWYKQLDDIYDAKFVLTVRRINSWLESMEYIMSTSVENRPVAAKWRERVYGTIEYDKEQLSQVYINHTHDVLDYFFDRKDDLLIMNIVAGDGWDVLCPFLDVPIPDRSFPHLNRRRE